DRLDRTGALGRGERREIDRLERDQGARVLDDRDIEGTGPGLSEAEPQRLVRRDEAGERGLQGLSVERLARLEQQGLVDVVRPGGALPQEPFLGRAQRGRARGAPRGGGRGRAP